MYFSKVTSVKTFVDLSRVDYSGQNKCYHSESFRELNQKENRDLFSFFLVFFFFFLRISSSWDEKKTLVISEWIHLSVFFSVNNATCRLHGCIGWVRHLWPSGDWELVFACRESRSKQARDRPR